MMLYPNGSTERPTVTSGFGPRQASGGASSYHRGADLIGFSIIRAVAAGVVKCSGSAPRGWENGGDQVWIQHDGFFSKSLHQARSLVSDGQWVNEGDPVGIGIMGQSGSAQGVHQHLEITPGELHFGNYGQVDPLAFIAARLSRGGSTASVGGQQRRTRAVANGRAEASSQSALVGDPLQDATVGDFVGFARGESVEGNDVWFKGTSGRWFWSGAFEGGANTANLPDLTPAASLGGQQRRTTTELNGRADARVNATLKQTLPAGAVGDFDGWKYGDAVGTENRWVRGAHSGDWFSLAYLEPSNVDNLADLNPAAPTPSASNERVVGAGGANGRTGPGRNYTVAQSLPAGTVGTFNGWTRGETVEGIDVWFRGALAGNWFWSGGFTSQSTDGLEQIATPTAPPPTATPTGDNPLGLPTHTPFYPDAVIGLDAPLGNSPRGTKGKPAVPAPVIIDQFHIHRTGSSGDDGAWFSKDNDRSSCPHLHVLGNGRTREFIRPSMKPALTGPDWNWRGYGVEIQGDGDGTAEQFERVADVMAWLASYEGKTLDGVLVMYNLRQRENTTITHREMLPGTECPGEWWQSRVDALLVRARQILLGRYTPAAPEPGKGDVVEVPRSKLQEIFEWLKGVLGRRS
ncbi:peptidoglycan DD-metalloendopeptidase family protein [Microbacterium sp. 5K110]|jgi:hypothetical protein|uniref:peptidoglycan DD-metalloendopeptidase family protein n=1 Tax=unclassified Microbacterium TaxID=2609290 RepID=UPI001484D9AA|nr:peptidoglycan DD-metalloendopeptidase family protein [Microbacterium sp. 5K110]